VTRGQFREDLYYRLAVVEARVPPLREHKDDLPLLVEHLLAAQNPPRTLDDLPPRTLELLRSHDWPGNVRELRNVLHRLVIFPEQADRAIVAATAGERSGSSLAHLTWQAAREQAVTAFEQQYLTAVLKRADGRVAAAAEAMGVTRQFAYRLFARYDIRCGDE
jgi:two-component system, NtrC family, response regulator GlrR